MTMNLKKDFILTSFNHRLFASPAFCGLFYQWFAIWRTFLLYKKKSPKNLIITREYSVYKAFGALKILSLNFIANFA